MIRRFVNLVAQKPRSNNGAYSLHRLDVGKHLFYPSTAKAEAANYFAKEEHSRHNCGGAGGDKPRRPSRIERLRQLPKPIVRFQQFRPSYQYDDDDDDVVVVVVEGPRIHLWSPPDEMFVLLSPRNRIFHGTEKGRCTRSSG